MDDDIPTGSTHEQYRIGTEFRRPHFPLHDVGTRTIIAIRIDEIEVASSNIVTGKRAFASCRVRSGKGRPVQRPPYGVLEQVFDEDDLNVCDIV